MHPSAGDSDSPRIQVHRRQPQNASSNQHQPLIAVMPHHPSAVILHPESRTALQPTPHPDKIMEIACPDARDEIMVGAPRRPRQELESAPSHRADQDHFEGLVVQDSPVARLPAELLAYIFELCVTQNRGSGSAHSFGLAHGPRSLAQVCKLWKAITEGDPYLWTSIHLYLSDATCHDRVKDVSRVKLVLDSHLKRSGALPISLTFIDHRIYDPATEDLIKLLVSQLQTHARRWERISLQLSCGYFPILFTFTPCDLASLEYFAIGGDMIAQHRAPQLNLNLQPARNLKSFSYSGPGNVVNDGIDLQWENLTDVSFEFAPHSRVANAMWRFRCLAQCQNLTTCSLGIDRTFRSQPNAQTITLPSLQTLRVRRLSAQAHARVMIDPLILPQLETLEIDAASLIGWNHNWHSHNFSDLLVRSKCALRHLSICDVDFPNNELVRCLTLSNELTSFRFIPCPRSQDIRDVIRCLDVSRVYPNATDTQESPGSDPLVPALREITLASSVQDCLDMVLDMFRSRVGARARAAGVAPLRRAEVVFYDLWHKRDGDRVAGRGLDDQLGKLARFQADLEKCVSENKGESGGGNELEGLEASVVVNSLYLPEYIDVVEGRPEPTPGPSGRPRRHALHRRRG